MPDNTVTDAAGTSTATAPGPVLVLTPEQSDAIRGASGAVWKKALYWTVGILGILLIVVVVLAIVLASKGKKDPEKVAKSVLNYARDQSSLADMDAKIAKAGAIGAEKAVIEALERIKDIEDIDERNKRLAELL